MSALAEALVAAQAELPCALGKDADGQIQSRTYRYLTLDKLIAETRPILQRHGLAIVPWPSYIARGDEAALPALETALHHVSGERINLVMPLYVDPKTMQGLGAAITYARRYAWQSVLGIVCRAHMAEVKRRYRQAHPDYNARQTEARMRRYYGAA